MNMFNPIIRVLIFVLLLSFSACSSRESSTKDVGIQIIPIETEAEDQRTFSDIADSIHFIPLETKPESLIGYINKLRITESRIYVLDKRGKCLFVFDSKGKYLFKIDKAGKGPGEYVDVSGFCVDNQGQIIISDFEGKKILFFDREGEFIREIYPDFPPSDIAFLGDGFLAVTSYYPNNRLNILDYDGKILRKEFIDESHHGFVYNNEIISGSESVYFRDFYVDTIYQVQKTITVKKYIIDYQDKKLLKSYYMSIPLTTKNGFTSRIIPEGFRFGCYNPVETDEYFSFYFWETPQRFNRHWCLYNKISGQTTYMNVNMDFDDLFGDRDPPSIIAVYGNKFCFPMDSYKLLGRLDKTLKNFAEKKPEALEEVKLIIESLTNNSNPVLVMLSVNLN